MTIHLYEGEHKKNLGKKEESPEFPTMESRDNMGRAKEGMAFEPKKKRVNGSSGSIAAVSALLSQCPKQTY